MTDGPLCIEIPNRRGGLESVVRPLEAIMKRFATLLVSLLAFASPCFAQGNELSKYVELLRSEMRNERTAIVTESLNMTEAQSTTFWPIYREYEKDLAALNDQRIELIKEYGLAYETMSDVMAKSFAGRAFKIREQRLALLKKYHAKVEKVLMPKLASRWAQVEDTMNSIVDLQIASSLPLMKKD